MNGGAAMANACWLASNMAARQRFHRALAAPAETQHAWLQAQLARHAASDFGNGHDFAAIADYAGFARRVPLADYDDFAPWIGRIRRGDTMVLSIDPVTHFAPTSGSSGARKLIPFTRGLTTAFDAAVGPWMLDLAHRRPRLVGGPAYWSVSPLSTTETIADPARTSDNAGAVPIGFADDAEYLGGAKAWLVRRAMAVPASIRHVRDERAFWCLSLLALLRQPELRLISVWHPSFLELLVAAAVEAWSELLEAVASGSNPWEVALPSAAHAAWRAPANRVRAAALRRIGASNWPAWWPRLQVVSCWGEQAAQSGCDRLRSRCAEDAPRVLVQRKGLLATEAVVTVPFADALPLAVCSHYFEFLQDDGDIRRAHELRPGAHYEVIVTNGGGLWRYRLGDVVECTGHLAATPTLRFLGRGGHVSDLRGEKLSEPFVAEALRGLWGDDPAPAVAVLRGWERGAAAGYELLLSTESLAGSVERVAQRLEALLWENPHYALARRLGQLAPLQVVTIGEDDARDALRAHAGRLGEAKPRTLVRAPTRETGRHPAHTGRTAI
ncbi:MAG: GH3 auxin-responsive promoter family protein [Gemmatimonadaceae bacterium]|nr:GH3 auxin-responsive promoter family protein [Gemmatimonadaceae bacterium]